MLLASSLFAATPILKSTSSAPAVEPSFRVGDTLTVASESAKVMIGSRVIGSAHKGQRILVVEVRNQWVGTQVMVAGEKKAGWIRARDFVPSASAARPGEKTVAATDADLQPQISTTARSIVTEAVEPSTTVPLRVAAPAEREHLDAFMVGRYDRHETDPNVHVWQPWMHR